MIDHLLLQKHTGSLKVTIHTPGGAAESFELSFTGNPMLFDYVGQAAAVIFTNMTTRLKVETRPSDWEVISFSPEDRNLEVRQVGGEPLEIEDDDPERLAWLMGGENPDGGDDDPTGLFALFGMSGN